ncbi:MAG TPA: DUF554 domain-containing protein [Thermoclostridium sp.]|nr:DUF554 domain-containing protein [Thermoclostridium sp.]HPU44627.1 DUF554 domain-containing protein [Thermoclostridium sp.]
MPIGIITNCLAILFGGLIGTIGRKVVPERLKQKLPVVFAGCALALGITLVIEVKNLAPVVLAIIVGTAIGELLRIEDRLHNMTVILQNRIVKGRSSIDEKAVNGFLTLLVLFSFSAGGIFGALQEGMTGDNTFLMVKSILDLFTSLIFATTIGIIVSALSVSTFVVYILFYLLASVLMPIVNETMAADFIGCGGILVLFIGIRMMELKEIPVANTLPSMLLVMPLSWIWTQIFR